jgi:hypothetical protein
VAMMVHIISDYLKYVFLTLPAAVDVYIKHTIVGAGIFKKEKK